MSQVLIINEDKLFGSSLKSQIEKSYKIDALSFLDPSEAFTMLEIFHDVQVIVCPEKHSQKVCEYLIKNYEKEVNVLIIGTNKTIYPTALAIPLNVGQSLIRQHIGFFLGQEDSAPEYPIVKAPVPPPAPLVVEETIVVEEKKVEIKEEIQDKDKDEDKTTVFKMPLLEKKPVAAEVKAKTPSSIYTAVNLKYFIDIPQANIEFNLFSRIKKSDSFDYSIKYAIGTKLSSADIERLITRGIKELFVDTIDYKKIHETLSLNFLSRFKNPNLTTIGKIQLNSDCFEIMLDVFKNSSMDKFSVEIIKEMIKLLTEFSTTNLPMLDFTECYFQKKLSYGYSHLHLTSILIFQIIDRFPWSKDQSKNKIIYLSLFHDMALHNDRLIKLHHNHAFEMSKLNEEEKQILHNHADAAASILENIIKAPKELTSIIREHHGLRSGKGFIESLSVGVTPLTMAFIVTENFATRYLEHCEKSETPDKEIGKELLEKDFIEMKLKFDKLTYLDVVLALEEFFKDR